MAKQQHPLSDEMALLLLEELRLMRAENKELKEEMSKINKVLGMKGQKATRKQEVDQYVNQYLVSRMRQ